MGGRQVRTGPEYGHIYDHFSVVYEYANGAKLFSNCRQQPGCKNDMSAQVVGAEGPRRDLASGKRGMRINARVEAGSTTARTNDMYQTEHDELFASIRNGKPINNGEYMAKSTLLAIMGRMAAYTGQEITWEMAMNSKEDLSPPATTGTPRPPPPSPCRGRRGSCEWRTIPPHGLDSPRGEGVAIDDDQQDCHAPSSPNALTGDLAGNHRGRPRRIARRSETARAGWRGQGRTGASRPTFQIACMTLPYSQFPLERALTGIKAAGYQYVAWGTTHKEDGRREVPGHGRRRAAGQGEGAGRALPRHGPRAADDVLGDLSRRTRTALEVLKQRIRQAAAGGVPQVLTFGHTEGGNRKLWVERFKQLGPMARDHGVTLVVKQHGGKTGTGAACAEIVREVNDAGIKVNYDAGNVMDYLDVDPIPDIDPAPSEVRSFCIKDHRNFPQRRGLRPGLRRDRPLQAAGPGRVHRPHDAALLREHLRPAAAPATTRKASTPWPAGPASSSSS